MTTPCPGSLQLHQHLEDPSKSAIAEHVAGCAACREKLAAIEAAFSRFDSVVFPRTVEEVVRRGHRPRWTRWLWFTPAPILAFAAVLIVLPRPHVTEAVARRGSDLMLTVFVASPQGVRAVKDGERIPPDAALRFEVHPPRECWLTILSLDGDGEVSRLFPVSDASAPVIGGVVPGGAVLNGTTAPERLFAVCNAAALPTEAMEQELRSRAKLGQNELRGGALLRSAPDGALQATLLLEKDPLHP